MPVTTSPDAKAATRNRHSAIENSASRQFTPINAESDPIRVENEKNRHSNITGSLFPPLALVKSLKSIIREVFASPRFQRLLFLALFGEETLQKRPAFVFPNALGDLGFVIQRRPLQQVHDA